MMENRENRSKLNEKDVELVNPVSGVTIELFELLGSEQFDCERLELVITGVTRKNNGKLRWSSVDDLVSDPYTHGLLDAISTISRIVHTVGSYRLMLGKETPRLRVRFEAKITDVFVQSKEVTNPIAWIHLGHGVKEFTFREIEELEEWEAPEFEPVPGISNDHYEKDFLSAEYVRDSITKMRGKLLFTVLPTCYASKIGEILSESEDVLCVHAPYDFKVPETLEFYDSENGRVHPNQTLLAWSEWVKEFEDVGRAAMLKLVRNKSGIFGNNQKTKKEAVK